MIFCFAKLTEITGDFTYEKFDFGGFVCLFFGPRV